MATNNVKATMNELMVNKKMYMLHNFSNLHALSNPMEYSKYIAWNEMLRNAEIPWSSFSGVFEEMSRTEKEDFTRNLLNWCIEEDLIDSWSRLEKDSYSIFRKGTDGSKYFLGKVITANNFEFLDAEELCKARMI